MENTTLVEIRKCPTQIPPITQTMFPKATCLKGVWAENDNTIVSSYGHIGLLKALLVAHCLLIRFYYCSQILW